MTETWYVMEDDTVGNPLDIAPDKDGVLRHKDGRAVAMGAYGPRSRGVDPEEERKKVEVTREMDAEKPKRKYTTRAMRD